MTEFQLTSTNSLWCSESILIKTASFVFVSDLMKHMRRTWKMKLQIRLLKVVIQCASHMSFWNLHPRSYKQLNAANYGVTNWCHADEYIMDWDSVIMCVKSYEMYSVKSLYLAYQSMEGLLLCSSVDGS